MAEPVSMVDYVRSRVSWAVYYGVIDSASAYVPSRNPTPSHIQWAIDTSVDYAIREELDS
jgi:hypothetical protein